MNTITNADLNRLKLLTSGKTRTFKDSGVINSLHSDFGIGTRARDKVTFKATDRSKVVRLVKRKFNIDLVNDELDVNRIEASKMAGNEKLATIAPKKNNIEVRSLSRHIMINGHICTMPTAEASMILDKNKIKSLSHPVALIIENYEAFKSLSIELLPIDIDFSNAILIYRGDKNIANADDILKTLGTPTYSWMDYDPHGFNLALAQKEFTLGTLTPQEPEEMYRLGYGKRSTYDDHIRFHQGLRVKAYPWVNSALDVMNKHLETITQEAIIHAGQRLKIQKWD
ncbi:DUF7281 domain-containing protein [Vibrio owensii]|uniref:DUF7281 domain-containing protein n=1 Tax=Vibrio owensii TaxID=696485 RepID=UPI003CC5CFDC